MLIPAAAASDDVAQTSGGAFSDDDGSVHEIALDALAARGYLDGTECGDGKICPSQPLKRWEMAVWLGRVLSDGEPDAVTASRFADASVDKWWAPHIERFADLGVTAGCKTDPLRYCPDRNVTRAQMATFFKRAFDLSDASPSGFADVAGGSHAANIDALAAAGVTAGCRTDPLRYCPNKSVTRAQMATFLARALGLVPAPSSTTLTAEEVYRRIAPSIPIVQTAYGQGSGILIRDNYVLTNHHVVWPNNVDDTATIVFSDGTEYVNVPIVATNPWADLAVLGPLETTKRPLALADGEQLPPGSELYLVGYPAEYEDAPKPTITRGILSRVRHWDGYNLTLLQTDAAIAGGQSGGALVDSRGQVVGVSTWIWKEGIGFGVATSASDDAAIIELMLTDPAYNYSFYEKIDLETGQANVWDIELAGAWANATFVVSERTDSVELALQGSRDAYVWLASAWEVLVGYDEEGRLVSSGSAEIDEFGVYLVEVGDLGPQPVPLTLHSSAALLSFYDEDGAVLIPEGETGGVLAGTFDYFGDIDWYEISLSRGDTVVIWTDSVLTDTALHLYDWQSNLVADDDDSGPLGHLGFEFNAQIEYKAPSTGVYYVQVFEVDAVPGGSYIVNATIRG